MCVCVCVCDQGESVQRADRGGVAGGEVKGGIGMGMCAWPARAKAEGSREGTSGGKAHKAEESD